MAFSTGGAFSGFTPTATTSTPGTSIFGQTNQNTAAPATTSIFGQPANNNTNTGNTTGTSLFGQPVSATTGTTPSLFGNTGTNTGTTNAFGSTQPTSGTTSLFGQPAAGTATTGAGTTSLFGNPTAAPAAGTSAFGSTNNATTTTGGAFGSTGAFGSAQPQSTGTTGSIFGQPAQSTTGTTSMFGQPQATAQTGTTGLFGQSTQPAAGTTSIFGQSTAPAQSGTNGLFGQTQPTAGTSAFSAGTGSMFGAKPTTPVAPTAQQGQVLFTKSTRFNDLPEDVKRVFEQMDTHIQGRLSIASSLKARKPAAELEKAEALIRVVHQDLLRAASAVHSDGHLVKDVRSRTDRQVEDVITSTRIVDAFRNPGQHGQLRDMADFPLEYFSRVTEDTATRLMGYRTAVEQVERTLASLVQSLQSQNAGMSPQAVGATLQTQHNSALALANRVGAAHAALDRVRALYTQLWRAKTGSSRDPFEERFGHGQEEMFGM